MDAEEWVSQHLERFSSTLMSEISCDTVFSIGFQTDFEMLKFHGAVHHVSTNALDLVIFALLPVCSN